MTAMFDVVTRDIPGVGRTVLVMAVVSEDQPPWFERWLA